MGKKTVRGHDIANRFVYSLKSPARCRTLCVILSNNKIHISLYFSEMVHVHAQAWLNRKENFYGIFEWN